MVILTQVEPDTLRQAVRAALDHAVPAPSGGRLLPTSQHLAEAARRTRSAEDDADDVRFFQALLEVGYLVASADGLAEQERHALAEFLEEAAAHVFDRDTLELHLHDLDAAFDVLGRRERLRRAAAEFESREAQEQALGFGALVALADGKLAEPELGVLIDLGSFFDVGEAEVRRLAERVVLTVEQALRR